jgi:hypothetical protein
VKHCLFYQLFVPQGLPQVAFFVNPDHSKDKFTDLYGGVSYHMCIVLVNVTYSSTELQASLEFRRGDEADTLR